MLDAQHGFEAGVGRLIAKLFELEIIKAVNGKLPVRKSYDEACAKLPVELVHQQLRKSHQKEYETSGCTFHGLKVLIPDGTKIAIPSTQETNDKYGAGQGHYVQTQALGFYELSTGTFEDFKFEHYKISERSIVQQHMVSNKTRTLYLSDAGFNGMAFIAVGLQEGHELLMPLKNCELAKRFLKTKQRSAVIEIELTQSHLANYPNHQHVVGTRIQVRLIRTRGTTRLKSQVLITTLLDENLFTWQELTQLYRQRYSVELAFRHLKTAIGIEKIRKQNLQRIEQLLLAAIILYNLSAALRNRIRKPSLLPQKVGIKLHCFTLCIELVHVFLQAAIRPRHGIRKKMDLCMRAIRNCWFIYKPWRAEPRICHTPPSTFSVQKGAEMILEKQRAEFLRAEYAILSKQYDQDTEETA